MSVQEPYWHEEESVSVAIWRGMRLTATSESWELHRHGERLTGGYWRQLPGQRPASAATRLQQNKHAAYAAAYRRLANAD